MYVKCGLLIHQFIEIFCKNLSVLSNLQKRPIFDTFEVKNDLRPLAKSADLKFRENDHFGRFRPFLATLVIFDKLQRLRFLSTPKTFQKMPTDTGIRLFSENVLLCNKVKLCCFCFEFCKDIYLQTGIFLAGN